MQQVKPQQQSTPQPQQQSTPQPQRLKPILKSSSQSNVQQAQPEVQADVQLKNEQVPQSNNGMETTDVPESVDGEGSDVPKWRRRVPGCKLSHFLFKLKVFSVRLQGCTGLCTIFRHLYVMYIMSKNR